MDQRQLWIDLRNSINTSLNGLTRKNVADTSLALFNVNILRGRGLLCRAIIKRLLSEPSIAPILASLTCIINSKLPEVGETLVARVVVLYKRGYVENNREMVDTTLQFLCELVLQAVVEDVVILQVLQVLLNKEPTDDSIRTAIDILVRAGGFLEQNLAPAMQMVFDRLRGLLQEGRLLNASQKRITELMRLRRNGLRLKVDIDLDLVPGEDKQTQFVDLSEKQDPELELSYFRQDNDYEAAEAEYEEMKKQILPEVEEEESETQIVKAQEKVMDFTDSELQKMQKNIYLTIMSSMSADEGVHKLLRLKRTQKMENGVLVDMIIKCCAQEKTYSKYFGVIGEKLCGMNRHWHDTFVQQFQEKYATIYQYEGLQLRNMGKFFGHLIASDTLDPKETLGCITLTEEASTSAGRVFVMFLFKALVEELGIEEVQQMVQDTELRVGIRGMFPVVDVDDRDRDHLNFAINYFTAIGLGVLTREMREVLENLPEPRGRKRSRSNSRSRSGSGSYSRSRSGSYSSGSYSRSRSGSYSRSRSGSYSRSRSPTRSRSPARSRSPSESRSRSRSFSRSPSRSIPANGRD
ncbi:CIC11C00000001295 [Sungouiella intermedia]|uniref:Pre-mRNA-splicing factor CWC22 n=1 Tax=Sungouiella intermedia TaxID=45354 RepID=A0A1L0BRX1_9ASCO|nr:CIC11C00000001295 [[Candida] intermedia]